MDTRKYILSAAVLLASAFTGFSTSLYAVDYSFLEGRYLLDAEFDDVDGDGDGFRFAGSFQVSNEIYAFAKYDDVELDDSDVDFSLLRIGAGYIHPLDASWDANVSLAYADAEADG
ncbi:MAG: hypothetical protein AB2541_05055, partial [Candidatus Thiodiazotropha sp.]